MESSNIESKLLIGRDWAKQLIAIMKQQPSCDHSKSTAKDLLVKIMEVLDGTISSLSMSKSTSSTPSNVDSGEVLSTLLEESKSEEFVFTISPSSVDFLDRRESKNTRTQERFVKESTTLVDDGHAWRKYGHKNTRDSNHPRDYFRCTNKFDQGCKATKQVQKVQSSPPKYRTVYFGQHTCKNLIPQPQNISCCDHTTIKDNDYDDRSSILFGFESTTSTTTKHGQINTFFPSSSSIEIEHIIDTEERSQNILSDEFSPPSSYLSPLDTTVVSGELDMPTMSMLWSSDFYGDMIMTQSGNLDMEMI